AERRGLLVGRVRIEPRQLLAGQQGPGRQARERHVRSAASAERRDRARLPPGPGLQLAAERRRWRPAQGDRARRLRRRLPERYLRFDRLRLVLDAVEAAGQGGGWAAAGTNRRGLRLRQSISKPLHADRGRDDAHVQSVPAPSGLTRPAAAFAVALLTAIAAALALASETDAPSSQPG